VRRWVLAKVGRVIGVGGGGVGGGGVCRVVSAIRVGARGWEGAYSVLH